MSNDQISEGKRKRIISLDLLRGFFLFVIIVDHIQRWPNGFDFLTGRGDLWMSAAEGFVTVSGILVGYIYGPRMVHNLKQTWLRLWKRALVIYAAVVGLSFFFMFYSFAVAALPNESLEFVAKYKDNIPGLLFDTFTLQYMYGWSEFLSHYVIFLLFAPLILWLVVKRMAFLVVILSVLLWMIVFSPFELRGRYDFTASWQLLFVLGIVIGYYFPAIVAWVRRTFTPTQRIYGGWAICISGFILAYGSLYLSWGNHLLGDIAPALRPFTDAVQTSWNTFFTQSGFEALVDKVTLGPLRIIFGAVVFWALLIIFQTYREKIDYWTGGILRTLGEKSLFVYGLQSVVVFLIGLYVLEPTSFKEIPILSTGVTAFAIWIIYYITARTSIYRRMWQRITGRA